ncbi:hypothetical protein BS50DRAFT_207703 [Corynespora cassiicola Philippines]|uniref:Uncharacterized protein n=1 Tax=Corynespora cassiicola Philippines TaxID=1448308 RepID=A0A2T2N4J9_CORCC|nr:hypothetical protein BS50DRAFT_207703 [Corynespora cassiicola Philippines]
MPQQGHQNPGRQAKGRWRTSGRHARCMSAKEMSGPSRRARWAKCGLMRPQDINRRSGKASFASRRPVATDLLTSAFLPSLAPGGLVWPVVNTVNHGRCLSQSVKPTRACSAISWWHSASLAFPGTDALFVRELWGHPRTMPPCVPALVASFSDRRGVRHSDLLNWR